MPLAVAVALLATAQDWPGWRGAGRDGKVEGFAVPARWPERLERAWRVEVGGGHSTPALVGGRLYVHARDGADHDVVLCLDAATRKEAWRSRLEAPYAVPSWAEMHGKGPFSSPAVAEGRLFAFGINGVLSCLDAETGRLLWRRDFRDRFAKTVPENGTAMSPLVVDGLCLVHAGGPGTGGILALDPASGRERWSWDGDGPAYASPVVASIAGKRQVVTQTQKHAVGVSLDGGQLLWKLEFKTYGDQNSVTPVVSGSTVVLSGLKQGIAAWRLVGERPEKVWETSEVSMYMSTPVLQGERLYGFSETALGQFFCLDAASGRTLWKAEGRQGENAALLDAGRVIVALVTPKPETGDRVGSHLVVFDADDRAYVERVRYKVAETPAWAHPVLWKGSVFVKDRDGLARWAIP